MGSKIIQTFESYDDKTKISIDIDLKTRGILAPFSYLPIINANHAMDTIIQSFVEYSTRPYTLNEKIIEYRIQKTLDTLVTMQINEFADELSSDSPAPGGGSVSALVGVLGAALVASPALAAASVACFSPSGSFLDLAAGAASPLPGTSC